MKILFVSSGNSKTDISPVVKNQGESLKKESVELNYFTIKGRGARGYLNSIFKLRRHLKNSSYDIVHAHYWLSALVASLAGGKNIVVSLMGDDVKTKKWYIWIIYIFKYLSWSAIIVKSKDMYLSLGLKDTYIVPNGIDRGRFRPIPREIALERVGWSSEKKHILFTSDPNRVEKNFKLAKDAFEYIGDKNLELHFLKDIPNEETPYYYNASSVVVLTSLWEGSPNAIKESMSCNIPIVATNVGDVMDVLSQTDGCYISSYDYREFASDIKRALSFGKRTTGRADIQYLKSELIAKKIVDIYKNVKGI
ncbi:glycosyltransferase family 4 protein [Sulfurovum sp. bin170]|uniref:glycosyltransferase n=1 Tax=Sulfurovum sp. bin170 TaxID=2695268 RepID=UPI0013DEC90B|nr:glycosyltransferase [Sulfurovum sp. bin170]NEW61434.1 glycosyltransferase family 4 protein [Sulfurovum sp. bin170]